MDLVARPYFDGFKKKPLCGFFFWRARQTLGRWYTCPMVRHKGFTLIELLVVIAIIGGLAAVVSAALNNARARGNDAAIKSNLSSIRTQAELFYAVNGDYGVDFAAADCPTTGSTMFALDGTIQNALGGSALFSTPQCAADNASAAAGDATSWAISAGLSGGVFWCVDATGFSGSGTAAVVSNVASSQ